MLQPVPSAAICTLSACTDVMPDILSLTAKITDQSGLGLILYSGLQMVL